MPNVVREIRTDGTIVTIAGSAPTGFAPAGYSGDGGLATSAQLYGPADVAVDASGNVFIADYSNNAVREVRTDGTIVPVAGDGTPGHGGDGGPARSAQLNNPTNLTFDAAGDLFISEWGGNSDVREIRTDGTITTVAGNGSSGYGGDGGRATLAQLSGPSELAFDAAGNLYIADSGNNAVRRVGTDGTITTVAGVGTQGYGGDGGLATLAQLSNPTGVSVDSAGNLFIADSGNNAIRRVDTNGIITTVAGDGAAGYDGNGGRATAAHLSNPSDVNFDASGNLLIADSGNTVIRSISSGGTITTVAGTGTWGGKGPATQAQLFGPTGLAADAAGDLFIADSGSYTSGVVREVRPDGTIVTVAGIGQSGSDNGDGGLATRAALNNPFEIAVGPSGQLFIRQRIAGDNREVAPGGTITSFDELPYNTQGYPVATFDPQGDLVYSSPNPSGVYLRRPDGTTIVIAGNGQKLSSGDGGAATAAGLYVPKGVAYDAAGDLFILTSDSVRKVLPDGVISSVYAIGDALHSRIAVDPQGDLYVFDSTLGKSVEVHLDGATTTVLGDGTIAAGYGTALAADGAGNLYFTNPVGDPNPVANVIYRVGGMSLTVSPVTSSSLQAGLTGPGTSGTITIQPTSNTAVSTVVAAIDNLNSPAAGTTETVVLDLGGGTFTTDTHLDAPAGVTVIIQNGTLVGGSPALIVDSGTVVLKNVTAQNATNAPTILVNGGSLTVRNSTIQESTGFAQTAILITGGTADLGTAASPGGNTFNVNGAGTLIQNTTGTSIPAVGNVFENNGVAAPSILVLNPTAKGALTIAGNSSIAVPGVVIVESSSAAALSISGSAVVSSPLATGVAVPDPLAALSGPSTAGLTNYGSFNLAKGSQTICPGIYSQIKVSGNASLTLNPGTYIIEGGGLTVTGNACVSGSGVIIYNAGSNYPSSGGSFGGITLSGNGTFNLTAPTTGPYAGVLIFQSRQNTRALSFSGNAMAGMIGTIYAANAVLSLSGNAQLTNPLIVGALNLSGNVALTQTAAGSDGTGDTAGIANTLMAGDLNVYINDPGGLFTSDELARIHNAVSTWDALLAPHNVTIGLVTDPTQANMVIDTSATSACGGMTNGVLGCFNAPNAEITMIQGWNWYAGADPSQIGTGQYDFETTVLHELGHALGLGGGSDPSSPMYESLAAGVADRTVTTQDLNIPDPPAGADPQMAAGFNVVPAAVSFGRNDFASTPAVASSFITIGIMPLPSAQAGMSTQTAVDSGEPGVVSGWVSPQAGVESKLVIQDPGRGDERALRPLLDHEAVDLLSLLERTQRSTEPAVDSLSDPERPVRARSVYRADEPLAMSDRVPSHLADDSALTDLVTELRARDVALGMLTPAEDLDDRTVVWEAGVGAQIAAQPVQHHTGFQPPPEILTDMATVSLRGSRHGASSSPAQPADLLLKAGLYGIGASVLMAKTLSAGRMDGKRRLFGFRGEFSR
jgi:hypothetical protein